MRNLILALALTLTLTSCVPQFISVTATGPVIIYTQVDDKDSTTAKLK